MAGLVVEPFGVGRLIYLTTTLDLHGLFLCLICSSSKAAGSVPSASKACASPMAKCAIASNPSGSRCAMRSTAGGGWGYCPHAPAAAIRVSAASARRDKNTTPVPRARSCRAAATAASESP